MRVFFSKDVLGLIMVWLNSPCRQKHLCSMFTMSLLDSAWESVCQSGYDKRSQFGEASPDQVLSRESIGSQPIFPIRPPSDLS